MWPYHSRWYYKLVVLVLRLLVVRLPKHHSLNLFAWRRCATSEVTLVESSRPDDRGGQR